MVPKESGFNQSETTSANARAQCVVFHARLQRQGMVKLFKGCIVVITEAHFAS